MLHEPNPHTFPYPTILREMQILPHEKKMESGSATVFVSDYLDIEEVTDSEGDDAKDEEGVPHQGRVPRRCPATFHDVHP